MPRSARRSSPNPPNLSRAELEILSVLWTHGRRSVREVHDEVEPTRGWAYTTTKTIMDRMAAKGILARQSFHGIALYEPRVSRPAGLARFVAFFANRVLGTDAAPVMALLAGSQKLSAKELRELERILAELEDE